MKKCATLCLLFFAAAASGADLELTALRVLAGGDLGPPPWREHTALGDVPVARFAVTLEQARAITNRADVLALAAAEDAAATAPRVEEHGIIIPSGGLFVVQDANGKGWWWRASTVDGQPYSIGPASESPLKSRPVLDAMDEIQRTNNAAYRTDLKAVRDLARTNRVDFIGVSSNALVIKESVQAIPVLTTTNQWTRQHCNAIRTALIDLSTELRRTALNNRQASGDQIKTVNALLKDSAPGGE